MFSPNGTLGHDATVALFELLVATTSSGLPLTVCASLGVVAFLSVAVAGLWYFASARNRQRFRLALRPRNPAVYVVSTSPSILPPLGGQPPYARMTEDVA